MPFIRTILADLLRVIADSVSELVGDVMESAIEQHLFNARITFRKT